jgi:hypothetical protein
LATQQLSHNPCATITVSFPQARQALDGSARR